MTIGLLVGTLALAASLLLAVINFRSHGLSFESGARMTIAWCVIIAVTAFVADALGA